MNWLFQVSASYQMTKVPRRWLHGVFVKFEEFLFGESCAKVNIFVYNVGGLCWNIMVICNY